MNKLLQTTILFLAITVFNITCLTGQEIVIPDGFSPQIGTTVSMLEDLKRRVTNSVADLTMEETDFLLDEKANRIGALIFHLAATEKYYQLYTFEGRGYNKEESEYWGVAQGLGEKAQESLKGKPIQYYLEIWDKVRATTLRVLKSRDDKWFKSKVKVKRSNMNNHWAWYHVMEHQANHMGQIRLITKRMQ